MRLSLNVTNYSWPGGVLDGLAEVAGAADGSAIDTLWVSDHLMQAEPGRDSDEPMLEAYTVLGWLAHRTTRLRLGTMVAAVTFRPPALLIKAVTTLDVLSGGRAWLGIGAGYHAAEADAFGLPLPPQRERFEVLEDTLELAGRMWAGDESRFDGRRVRALAPVGRPLPVHRPGVLIGGAGEQRTLRLVARHGDACNLFDIPDGGATVRHKLSVLERHCAEAGRPMSDIDKTISTRYDPNESAADFADRCRRLGDLGLDHVVCITAGPWTASSVARVAAVAAELADGS